MTQKVSSDVWLLRVFTLFPCWIAYADIKKMKAANVLHVNCTYHAYLTLLKRRTVHWCNVHDLMTETGKSALRSFSAP